MPLSPRYISVACCVLALCVSAVTPAHAQWSTDAAVNLRVCAGIDDQRNPVMVSDGAGGVIIVWEDQRNGSIDLFAQRVASDGRLLWNGTAGVPVSTAAGVQQHPDILATGDGGVFIVWEDGRGTDLDIFAQRLDSNGTAQWAINGLPVCITTWQQVYPRLTTDNAGGVIVVWQDSRNLGYDVFAQRMNGAGTRLWAPTGVAVCSIEHTHLLPRVVSDGRGGAIVVWEEGRSYISQRDIYAQRIGPSGGLLWPTLGVGVCTAFNTQQSPQVVSDGNGGAIIAWQDHRNNTNAGDIYAQRIDSSGQMLWTVNGTAVTTAIGAQHSLRIVADHSAASWLCWIDERGVVPAVYAQSLTHDGGARWTTGGVNVAPQAANASAPAIDRDAARGIVVAWTSTRPGYDADIVAQRLDSTSSLLWGFAGLAVSSADGAQGDATVLADRAGTAIICWTDRRSGNDGADIFAAKTGFSGLIPVELSQFSAVRNGARVELRWRTEREDAHAGFDLLRTVDGDAWVLCGSLPGAPGGSSRLSRDYAFTDDPGPDAAGELWYRLRMRNMDGSVTLGAAVRVAAETVVPTRLIDAVWPLPAVSDLRVTLTLSAASRVEARIVDMTGRVVAMVLHARVLDAGSHLMTLPLGAVAPGAYLLVVDDGVHIDSHPLHILRTNRD